MGKGYTLRPPDYVCLTSTNCSIVMYPPNKTLEFTKLQVSLRQLIINHHKSANISYKSHEISLFLWFSHGFSHGFSNPPGAPPLGCVAAAASCPGATGHTPAPRREGAYLRPVAVFLMGKPMGKLVEKHGETMEKSMKNLWNMKQKKWTTVKNAGKKQWRTMDNCRKMKKRGNPHPLHGETKVTTWDRKS